MLTIGTMPIMSMKNPNPGSVDDYIAKNGMPQISQEGTLDLGNKNLTSLEGLNKINNIKTVKKLLLDENKLANLPKDTFAGFSNLEHLNLNSNKLISLPENIFTSLSQLKVLRLDNNKLNTLPVGVFKKLNKLVGLWIKNNQLQMLQADTFANLKMLQELWLENNQLKTLPNGVFNGLNKLMFLQLQNNKLETLPEKIFKGLDELRILNLSYNNLTNLPKKIFAGLDKLYTVALNNNYLIIKDLKVDINDTQASSFASIRVMKEDRHIDPILAQWNIQTPRNIPVLLKSLNLYRNICLLAPIDIPENLSPHEKLDFIKNDFLKLQTFPYGFVHTPQKVK
jgi:Leucine-rich repeat (LRR) protein